MWSFPAPPFVMCKRGPYGGAAKRTHEWCGGGTLPHDTTQDHTGPTPPQRLDEKLDEKEKKQGGRPPPPDGPPSGLRAGARRQCWAPIVVARDPAAGCALWRPPQRRVRRLAHTPARAQAVRTAGAVASLGPRASACLFHLTVNPQILLSSTHQLGGQSAPWMRDTTRCFAPTRPAELHAQSVGVPSPRTCLVVESHVVRYHRDARVGSGTVERAIL